jgi:RES domain-containing protein
MFEDKYDFEELFYRDIESWFSADIACCDKCYDDFVNTWPYAYWADNEAFQKCGIDLDTFFSGSRLQDIYTEEEFDYFIRTIGCPRCGAPLSADGNIWPYCLPFKNDSVIESTIDALASIAERTPFLLLNHHSSERVLSAIANMSSNTVPTDLSQTLFRARSVEIVHPNIEDFDFPPKRYVGEGRYNHAGMPVLYLASDKKTCFYEMRESVCTVAEIKIRRKLKILDFMNLDESSSKDTEILKTLVYSALISSKQENEGWHRPKYVFSRFVADCALHAGFHAIKYPSTRLAKDNYNLVIIDSTLSLESDCDILSYCVIKSVNDV